MLEFREINIDDRDWINKLLKKYLFHFRNKYGIMSS